MATLSVTAPIAFDPSTFFDSRLILDGDIEEASATLIRLRYSDGQADELLGVFVYFDDGSAAGTITGYRAKIDAQTVLTLSGISVPLEALLAAGETESEEDDVALVLGLFAGDDRITGNRLGDHLFGLGGSDVLIGNAGDDVLDGGAGNDLLIGGLGRDRLIGGLGADELRGGFGGDVLQGGAAADLLLGEAGNDRLAGGGGNDRLVGGLGRDRLTGGAGRDVFEFGSIADSTVDARDLITDFARGVDRIDLRAIDAHAGLAGDQAFVFIGDAAFSGAGGELRFAGGVVSGDVDGDGAADFAIGVAGLAEMDAADFAL